MFKQAYLLLIHEQNEQLGKLLELIDGEHNDIFIHVDKKSKSIDKEEILSHVKKSHIIFVKRHKVYWGGYSGVRAEYELLREATENFHDYYHLISGADLPLASQNEIIDFLISNGEKEYVHFGPKSFQSDMTSRHSQYHFFQKRMRLINSSQFWNKAETYSIAIQRRMKIDRTKKRTANIFGGANWFSITHGFAEELIRQERKIKRLLFLTQNSDEMFVQTVLKNSEYKDKLYYDADDDSCIKNLRYVDWSKGKNGGPGILTMEDYEAIRQSKCLFARKFDYSVDKEIVDKIYNEVKYMEKRDT